MGGLTALHDAGNCCRHLRGYHHGPGKDRRPVNRLNSQPENKLHHVLGHYRLSSIDMVCLVPIGHPLATQDTATIHDIASERLIFFHPNTPHGKLVRQIFDAAGIEPNISIETRFAETAPHLMREGFGIALQDRLTSLGVHEPGLKVLTLVGTQRQPVLFHCRSDHRDDKDIQNALTCVRQAIAELGFPDEYEPLSAK